MIVFPMAGLSSRFSRAGYDQPKWMLPLAGRPLLDWSLMSFQYLFEQETCLIIHLDNPDVSAFIRDRVQALGIQRPEFVALQAQTRGQADTVAAGLTHVGAASTEPLTIFNVDTIRPGYRPPLALAECDGWLECFEGEGDHWSFVRPVAPDSDRAAQVTEKVRVSPYCSTGLYWFRSVGLFSEAFAAEEREPSGSELYVAPLYQHLIRAGRDIRFGVIDLDKIFFSGTPDEYQSALTEQARIQMKFVG